MQKRALPVIPTLIAAAAAFLLSRVIWPDIPSMPAPTSSQLPFFIVFSIIEALGFGTGVAFLIFGWKFMKGRTTEEWLAFFSVAWLLVSWWPHDNLHRVMEHGDYWGLLKLEYGFHATLIIAGVILGGCLWKKFSKTQVT